MGNLFSWWNIYLLPTVGIPSEYSDPERYGRISTWGFARVTESTFDNVPVGSLLYGYLPIGTLPVDFKLEPAEGRVKGNSKFEVVEKSPHRQTTLPIYNQYLVYRPNEAAELISTPSNKDYLGWSSLMQVLFLTSWGINKFIFTRDKSILTPPSSMCLSWEVENADVIPNSVTIILSASTKTGLALAHQLRHARPLEEKPRLIIGVVSKKSFAFTVGTGLYDKIFTYDAVTKLDTLNEIVDPSTATISSTSNRVILFEFGSRGNAARDWFSALKSHVEQSPLPSIPVIGFWVGSPPTVDEEPASEDGLQLIFTFINASDYLTPGKAKIGEEEYWKSFLHEWKQFVADGAVRGLSLQWGSSMDDVKTVWDTICSDQIDARKGYVFEF